MSLAGLVTEPDVPPVRTHPDVWVDPADDPRDIGLVTHGERDTLLDYLRVYRLTFQMKCDGLDAEQLARRSVPPSTMSLLGLLRHLAGVEHTWFRVVLSGEDSPRPFRTPTDRDAEFTDALADDQVVAQAWQVWRREVAFAEAYVARTPDLSTIGIRNGSELELRDVLVHMVEEYARHCGHADLLRECIDGRTGQ